MIVVLVKSEAYLRIEDVGQGNLHRDADLRIPPSYYGFDADCCAFVDKQRTPLYSVGVRWGAALLDA